jgi:hypothetical protein
MISMRLGVARNSSAPVLSTMRGSSLRQERQVNGL